ncbi:nucleotide-diphospho-sugar transferase [Talaromyces proteolyticus]|uniref:Nucleotide-diphospho-sugar transferase n=1 Tax=Talaromyces proteolyticus TaxID=1131652 RepID=A0AAD4KPV9_9EURO|nr:nucleotide-diphospho-sugar transferase [Talaromyces proteolyticus]KAH8695543.1 nucleotide-diphospho-sugar transferase [Talaromyces proteolyticus]
MAPNYEYTLIDEHEGERFIAAHFGEKILDLFRSLPNRALKSDLLRYLLLFKEGGYYGDLDTEPVKPLDQWVPNNLKNVVRLVVALEHDAGVFALGNWKYPVQFCQWTIVSAPGHPVLESMIQRAIRGLEELAQSGKMNLDKVKPTDRQVLSATGPQAWTEEIVKYLIQVAPEITSYESLLRTTEPKLYHDVLVYPLDGFMTLSAEMSLFEGAGEHQLAHHEFRGAWKQWDG